MVEAKAARGNPRQERPDLQPNQSPPRQPPTLLDRDHWCCHRWQWLWQGRCWFRRRQVADDVSEAAHQARPQQAHLEAENRPRNRADRNKQAGPPLPTVAPAAAVWSSRATTRRCIRKSLQERRLRSTQARCKAQLLARLRARRHEAGWAPAASATPGPVSVVSPIATTAPFPCPGEARHLCVLAGWYRCAAIGNPLRLRSRW